jgi:hypothetical protein
MLGYIKENAQYADEMVTVDMCRGKSVVICGPGPSLATFAATPPFRAAQRANQVWGCNSALAFLHDHGARVTHGVAVDPSVAMLSDLEFGRVFDVRYFLASSVSPDLTRLLLSKGCSIRFFHNFIGCKDPDGWVGAEGQTYESYLYNNAGLYPPSVRTGHGLSVVPRAVCLALVMGFDTIQVYGADCACAPDGSPMPDVDSPEYSAWLDTVTFYADGRSAACYGRASGVFAEAVIDGRRWHTRADMAISAQNLLEIQKSFPGRIELMGDTLPNAIRDKDATFFANLPKLTQDSRVIGFGTERPELAEATNA